MRAAPHRPSLGLYPLALLAAAFAAGILCGRASSPPLLLWLAPCACLSALMLAALARGRQSAASLFVALAFACAGATLSSIEREDAGAGRLRSFYDEGRIEPGDAVELTGVLERAPEEAPDGLVLSLSVERLGFRTDEREAAGRVELFAPARDESARESYAALELRRGARVRVMTAPARAEAFRNPGVEPFGEYLEHRGLDARGTIKSPLLVERLDDEAVFLPLAWLDTWRSALLSYFDRKFSHATAGVVGASMLGNRHGLTREVAEKFRAGGTFHVLVISGLHITFVGWFAWMLAGRATKRKVLRWALAVACVWAYALAVGAEAAVVRAALMFTVASLAPALGRRSGTLNALGGAALALLVWRPGALFDPSFQLTFLSVLSIVALAWPLVTKLKEVGEWRPTRATPYPPACPRWFRVLGEILFWSERRWRAELARQTHSYGLYKTKWAARLERFRLQRPLRYVFAAALISAGVQAGMLPLLVLYFHRISFAALLLNILVGVLICVLSFTALAAFAASALGLSTLEAVLIKLGELSSSLMVYGVEPFERLRIAGLRLPEYSGAAWIIYPLYFIPLAVLVFTLARWSPVANVPGEEGRLERAKARRAVALTAFAYLVLLFLIVAHPFSAGRPDGRLHFEFLDVGQGDSTLITTPDGATLLVDGGGRPTFSGSRAGDSEDGEGEAFERDARGIGERVVSEHLWWRGLDSVDYVVATHADADHIQGLVDVLQNFSVRAALVARAPARESEFGRFAGAARGARVPIHIVGAGDRVRFGEVTVDVLWPPLAINPSEGPSRNNDSLVLRVAFRERCVILTGDIEREAESALVAAGATLRCDVVKVAHHGSRTSSTAEFVGATRPSLAVVSAGLLSPYGHPHAEVVARWRAAGAEFLMTARRGMISVSTDGHDLRVETFVKE